MESGDAIKRYRYEVTKHSSRDFDQLVYFCTDKGECSLDQLPSDQTSRLEEILNERGAQGWDLVQLFFGNDGLVALWKKTV